MKKTLNLILAILLVATFGLFALGSGEEDASQGSDKAESTQAADKDETLGDYQLEILSCRLAKSYDDKDVAIVKYKFTNNAEEAQCFSWAFDDEAYQDGVGLNRAYVLKDSANYSEDNQIKQIKNGVSLEVEVAYELNDSTTDIQVEVKELISFSDKTITKIFSIK